MATVPGIKLKSVANKSFDPATQCVGLKVLLDNGQPFHIVVPRGITGVFVMSVLSAMATAADQRTEQDAQPLKFEALSYGLDEQGAPVLYFQMEGKVRLPMQMTADNLASLRAALADLERLAAPPTGRSSS